MTVAVAERKATDIRSIINPLPSQERLLDAQYEYEYLLFGGAAGPGKSYILRWAAIDFLMYAASQGHYGVRVGLFCEDYPSLKDRQVTKIRREFPTWLGELKGSQDEGYGFFLRPQWGSGAIMLRNLDKPAKYASAEFAGIYVDELTKNTRQMFDDLRFRKRWIGMDHSPFVAATNPGSAGHAWVKKLWIDQDFSGDDDRLDPSTFLFIPARIQEMIDLRPELIRPSYLATLNSLPDAMRRAMLDGDWTVFSGQVFSEWRSNLHVCEPFKIPASWTRWVAIDYGFANPFCALWFARSPDKKHVYIYRELYERGWLAREQARRVKAASEGERIWLYAADPSMWQKKRETTGISFADEYGREGLTLTKANNERLAGWDVCHEALAWKELPNGRLLKEPRLQVFSTCPNFIRTVPALPYDPIKVEDVDTDAEDHPGDAWRYGMMAEVRAEVPSWHWKA